MSQSIRFLGLAIFTWAGIRAFSLGLIPGTETLTVDAQAAQSVRLLPPIQPSLLPPIEPVSLGPQAPQMAMAYQYQGFAPYPIYVPVPAAGRGAPPQVIYLNPPHGDPREVHVYGAAMPAMSQLPQSTAAMPVTARQSTPTFASPKLPQGLDRLSVASWATVRNEFGPDSLASSGILGGSEAGARVMWNFTPRFAASLRASAPVNSQRGAEAALGIRYQPLAQWPIAVTLERRHGFKQYGQSAFALFAEGGLYGQPMPWRSTLDGYFQAGLVDFNNPDWFVDGQAAVTRPVWRNLSAGFGAWGGAQPGLSRVDVGPRLSLRMGARIRAHVDYRLNVAGNARPGSGTVATLAGDF